MIQRPLTLLACALLSAAAFAQTTVQVPVPAKPVVVQVPAVVPPPVTPPPLVLTGPGGISISLAVPAVQPPAITPLPYTYTVPPYTVPYTPAVVTPPPVATTVLIGPNAGPAAPTSCTTTAAPVGAWTISGGVVSINGATAGFSASVVLGVCTPAVFYQENASCQWYSAAGTPTAVTWNATLAPTGVTVPACPAAVVTPPVTGTFGVKASGGKLVSTVDGVTPVELIGPNFSGLENGQAQSFWTAYANSTLAFWQSVKSYSGTGMNGQTFNSYRLQVNSAYWLGYACGLSASTYQATVQHVVSMATQAGLYTVLVLHWDAVNSTCPIGQGSMPTANSTAFWASAAALFKGNPAVVFELYNEPFGTGASGDTEWGTIGGPVTASDSILANGGSYTPFYALNNVNGGNNQPIVSSNVTYTVAGEIQLLNTIRGTGATNLVLASSGGFDGAVFQWLNTYNAKGNPDPLKNFGATWHDYPGWTGGSSYALAIVAAGYPLVITETYGFDTNLNAVGNFTSGGTGLSETAGYAFARTNNIGYMCGYQVQDWGGETTLSLTTTPPWSGCASQ
jgi:endoglucanase